MKSSFIDTFGVHYTLVPSNNATRIAMVRQGLVSTDLPPTRSIRPVRTQSIADTPPVIAVRQIQRPSTPTPTPTPTTPEQDDGGGGGPSNAPLPTPAPQDRGTLLVNDDDQKPVAPPVRKVRRITPRQILRQPAPPPLRASNQLFFFRVRRRPISRRARMTMNTAVLAQMERTRNAIPKPGRLISLMNRDTMTLASGVVSNVIVKRRGGARGYANTGMVVLKSFVSTDEPVRDPSNYFEYTE